MCGRYTLLAPPEALADLFRLAGAPAYSPRHNIAPTQHVLAVRVAEGGPEYVSLRWGLVPSWAKEVRGAAPLINARSETAAAKPAFRNAFRKRRCLIPADGFYEWSTENGRKQPFWFRLAGDGPFAFAGLWEHWAGPDGAVVESCAILTTEANELVRPLHERMPVIVNPRHQDQWLDPIVQDPEALARLLRPFRAEDMYAQPVAALVNDPRAGGTAWSYVGK